MNSTAATITLQHYVPYISIMLADIVMSAFLLGELVFPLSLRKWI